MSLQSFVYYVVENLTAIKRVKLGPFHLETLSKLEDV